MLQKSNSKDEDWYAPDNEGEFFYEMPAPMVNGKKP